MSGIDQGLFFSQQRVLEQWFLAQWFIERWFLEQWFLRQHLFWQPWRRIIVIVRVPDLLSLPPS